LDETLWARRDGPLIFGTCEVWLLEWKVRGGKGQEIQKGEGNLKSARKRVLHNRAIAFNTISGDPPSLQGGVIGGGKESCPSKKREKRGPK